MMPRRNLTVETLERMRATAHTARAEVADGNDPRVEDIARLAGYVDTLIDEVDALVWRATAATMMLDGRITHDEIMLDGPPR